MAVKVGESWVSEAALTYAKEKVDSETVATLKELSDRYPGVNFSTNTQPFSQKGTNNIQIAPDILSQMKNDPEKRASERKEEKIRIRKEQEEKRIEKKSDRVNLSDKAQALLDEMKRKYSNMDFFVADYSSSEEASGIMSRGSKEYGVLLDPETLEAMAKDGSVSFFADLEKPNEKQYKVKKANVEALSVEDLIEKIKHVDWHSVSERAKNSGERINLFV